MASKSLTFPKAQFEVARIIGAERIRGFFTYFQRYDVAQMLDLSWLVGASMADDRIADHVTIDDSDAGWHAHLPACRPGVPIHQFAFLDHRSRS